MATIEHSIIPKDGRWGVHAGGELVGVFETREAAVVAAAAAAYSARRLGHRTTVITKAVQRPDDIRGDTR